MNRHFLTVWYGRHSSFLSPSAVTKFQGNPLSSGVKYTGWENIAIIAVYIGNSTK